MAERLSIDKKTTISIGFLLVLIPAFFYGVTAWTRTQTQVERNTSDITSILAKMDTLNANLVETNKGVVQLNARLDVLSIPIKSQPTGALTVIRTQRQSTPIVTIVTTPAPQQTLQQHQPEATPPKDHPQPSDTERLLGTVDNILQAVRT
jgi:hypothetical protein